MTDDDLNITQCNGFLFIGDPHLTRLKPGKRLDENFLAVVLDKIEQAFDIANKKKLVVVILGDLFDKSDESKSNKMMSGLLKILKSAILKPVCLVGNHDISDTTLTEDTLLGVVKESGLMHLISSNGAVGAYRVFDKLIGLGGTPYGEAVPDNADAYFSEDLDTSVWITHDDYAFANYKFPHAKPLKEIKGCSLMVNGHIHIKQPVEQVGMTSCFNPGNITRLSIDAKDHSIAVWSYNGDELECHSLQYAKNVFSLEGSRVEPASPTEISNEISSREGLFAELLKEDLENSKKTDDGAMLNEVMEQFFEEMGTDKLITQIIVDLKTQVLVSETT